MTKFSNFDDQSSAVPLLHIHYNTDSDITGSLCGCEIFNYEMLPRILQRKMTMAE